MWLFCLLDPFIPTQIKFLATPLLPVRPSVCLYVCLCLALSVSVSPANVTIDTDSATKKNQLCVSPVCLYLSVYLYVYLSVCSVWAYNSNPNRHREKETHGVDIPQGNSCWCTNFQVKRSKLRDWVRIIATVPYCYGRKVEYRGGTGLTF